MDLSILRKVLSPLANSHGRKLIGIHYRNPLRLLRRVYLHLEHTTFRHSKVFMLPPQIKLNTGYECNLKCPLCPTGRRDPRPSGQLTIAAIKSFLPHLKAAGNVELFGWGEPFLNREIFEIITLLKENRKFVQIDTNLSIANSKIIERIAESPIDLLTVSLDGANEESYSQYRIGGSFDLVIRNIRQLRSSKHGPRRIQWQFLVSRKNHDFMDKARILSEELGVEMLLSDIGMYNAMFYESSDAVKHEWWTEEQIQRLSKPPQNSCLEVCMYMYNDPFIDFNGDVYPCCHAPHAPKMAVQAGFQNVFGNLYKDTLGKIWNNNHFQAARSLFNGRSYPDCAVKPICLCCRAYLKRNPTSSDSELLIFNG